jgi:hypothetical protein
MVKQALPRHEGGEQGSGSHELHITPRIKLLHEVIQLNSAKGT